MCAHSSPNPVIFNPYAPSPLLRLVPLLSQRTPETVGHFSLMIDTPCSLKHTALATSTHTQGKPERWVVVDKPLNSWYVTCFSATTDPGSLRQQDGSHYLSSASQVSYVAHSHTHGSSRLLIYYLGPGLWALRGRSTTGTQRDRESDWQDSRSGPQSHSSERPKILSQQIKPFADFHASSLDLCIKFKIVQSSTTLLKKKKKIITWNLTNFLNKYIIIMILGTTSKFKQLLYFGFIYLLYLFGEW